MKLAMLAFSEKGLRLAAQLKAVRPEEIDMQRCPKDGLQHWTEQHFNTADALVFIGAAGIAVRAIAPFVRDKTHDPAVLVIDECAEFIIPLLSGHIGGANALAKQLAASIGARAVITTATDCNGLFAVDSWATEQGYVITNPMRIKQVSARLLSGEAIRLKSSFETIISTELTREIILTDRPPFEVTIGIENDWDRALKLVPRILTLGVGCKRGTSAAQIRAAFDDLCTELHLEPRAFCQVCSIDLKAKESGLLAFCREAGLPLVTFSSQALADLPGDFTASDFVRHITGVDNVCERSAVMGSAGMLLATKRIFNGVTMAIAQASHTVRISKAPAQGGAL
ncbi:MAG: cobalt-precorrin 5A hydrolase [Candidatus Fimivivens sp.]